MGKMNDSGDPFFSVCIVCLFYYKPALQEDKTPFLLLIKVERILIYVNIRITPDHVMLSDYYIAPKLARNTSY